jgi:outer membrane lipoprotein carrier protein
MSVLSFHRLSRFLLASAFLLAHSTLAQGLPQQLANTIDTHYNSLHSLSVEFTQSYDGMGMHRVERGTLLLSKGGRLHEGKMRWTYSEPAGKLFVLDGKNAYFYTPGQSEVQRVPAKQLDDLRSPLALLLGHADLVKQLGGLAVKPARDGDATLSGVPYGLEQRVMRLEITAGPDGSIRELVIEEADGARNSFQFSAEQPNAPAPAAAFVFTAPPGTHIVNGMPPI